MAELALIGVLRGLYELVDFWKGLVDAMGHSLSLVPVGLRVSKVEPHHGVFEIEGRSA